MKLNSKQTLIGVAVLIALAGGSYGAYTYIRGLPTRLTKAEAAKRYLEIACLVEASRPKLIAINERYNTVYYKVQGFTGRLYNSNNQLAQLHSQRNLLLQELASLNQKRKTGWVETKGNMEKAAHLLSDPSYIWPDQVKEEVKIAAAILIEGANEIKEGLKGDGNVTLSNTGEVFSSIRQHLGLNERNFNCLKVKAYEKKL